MVVVIILSFIIALIVSIWLDTSGPIFLVATILIVVIFLDGAPNTKKSLYKYQVKELEKNTVFNITDSIGGFKANDTAYVNMTKLMVDPTDTNAMQCVIIKELK